MTAGLSHDEALERIVDRGLEIKTVIDVGAAHGTWSLMARKHWPDARFHLIEAFEHWRPKLDQLIAEDASFSYSLAAAGETIGEIHFSNDPEAPYGGRPSDEAEPGMWRVPMVSIGSEVERLQLEGPFLVKLDTHGYECPILRGAARTPTTINLLVVEAYNFGPAERRFPYMAQFIEKFGLRCIDIGEPLVRTYGRSFWQIGLFCIPESRKEFTHDAYA